MTDNIFVGSYFPKTVKNGLL